jgi:hypothetical protein
MTGNGIPSDSFVLKDALQAMKRELIWWIVCANAAKTLLLFILPLKHH